MAAILGVLALAGATPASAVGLSSQTARVQHLAADVEPLPVEPGDGVPEGDDALLPPVTGESDGDLEGGVTGGDVAPVGTPILLDEEDVARTPVVLNDFVTEGSLTYDQAVAAAKKAGLNTEMIREPGPRSAPSNSTMALPSRRTLSITHQPQVLGYYCGPAVAQMILTSGGNGDGWYYSRYDSATRSQSAFGRSTYLHTTSNRGTPWADGRMKIALNRWVHGSTGGGTNHYWMEVGKPGESFFFAASQESIGDSGRSMAVNTVEREDRYHYNGHPNKTIGHWIANYGYDKYGYSTSPKFSFADPSTSVWSNASARFTGNNTFVYRFVNNGNGIVYSYKRS